MILLGFNVCTVKRIVENFTVSLTILRFKLSSMRINLCYNMLQILTINSFLDTNSAAWVVLGLAVFVISILITMWFFQRKRSQKVKKRAAKSERLKEARSMARKREYAPISKAANNETPSEKIRNPHEPLAKVEQVELAY